MTTRTTISAAASVSALALGALCAAPALGQENGDVTLDAPAFAEEEPAVEFPTCVGIARMEAGRVTAIPAEEGVLWDDSFDLLGDAVGHTVAVLRTDTADPATAVAELRAESAAADVDYLVVYEMAYDANEDSGPRAMDRLTTFPMFEGEDPADPARAAGAAVLMDVENGRMYGVASAMTLESELESLADISSASETKRSTAFRAVVTELAHEVETAFVGMMIKQGLPAPRAPEQLSPDEMTDQMVLEQADAAFAASFGGDDPGMGC